MTIEIHKNEKKIFFIHFFSLSSSVYLLGLYNSASSSILYLMVFLYFTHVVLTQFNVISPHFGPELLFSICRLYFASLSFFLFHSIFFSSSSFRLGIFFQRWHDVQMKTNLCLGILSKVIYGRRAIRLPSGDRRRLPLT